MKKIILVLLLVLAMCVPVFATDHGDTYNDNSIKNTATGGNASATGGSATGGSATATGGNPTASAWSSFSDTLNITNSPNNGQTIAPSQSIKIENPRPYLNVNPGSVPELNFMQGGQKDITLNLPSFCTGKVKPLLKSDCIVEVLYVNENLKFGVLYKTLLKSFRSPEILKSKNIRYQVIEVDSVKSWTTGGNIGGTGVSNPVGTAAGASASLVPQVGRSKVSNLYTIIIVAVQP